MTNESVKKICTESDVAPWLNNFFKMTPKIDIFENEKIDFFDRKCNNIPTFSNQQTCHVTRFIIQNIFFE